MPSTESLIGRTILHYRITGQLGSGGNGVVFKARDERLHRDVALKFLREGVTGSEAFERFQREARAASAIRHPNICTVYDIGMHEGCPFIAMEYQEGETLRERIGRGPLPVKQVLDLAVQIADALHAAHSKGMIHRDIKPANIFISTDGRAVVLDFGLVRRLDKADASALTMSGQVMGTTKYMSPEQALGFDLDCRTDIFSLGVVLYEMIAGAPPFKGETETQVLDQIGHTEPEALTNVRRDLPAAIEEIVLRCLEKDTALRYQTAGDLASDLRRVKRDLEGNRTPSKPRRRQQHSLIPLVLIALVAAAALAAALALYFRTPASGTRGGLVRLYFDVPDGQLPHESPIAISPDGTEIVYSMTRGSPVTELHRRRLDGTEATVIPGTAFGVQPAFSADGRWLAFFADEGLKRMPVAGGVPTPVSNIRIITRGLSWGPGDIIALNRTRTTGIEVDSADGLTSKRFAEPDPKNGESAYIWPQVMPDGKSIVYTARHSSDIDKNEVIIQSLVTGERKTIFRGATRARYSRTGHMLFSKGSTIYALPFDLEHWQPGSPTVSVVDDAVTDANGTTHFDVSAEGTLVYTTGTPREKNILVRVTRQGKVEELGAPHRDFLWPRVSPDGQRVAVTISDFDNRDIWVYDLKTRLLNRATFKSDNAFPVWDAAGQVIFFNSFQEQGRPSVFRVAAEGNGKVEQVYSYSTAIMPASVARNGMRMLMTARYDTREGVLLGSTHGDTPLMPFADAESFSAMGATFSPDGRYAAYSSNETGKWEVYVQSSNGGGTKLRISTNGGREPVWSPRGDEVFYVSGPMELTAARLSLSGEPAVLQRMLLFSNVPFSNSIAIPSLPFREYDIFPDGSFLMVLPEAPVPLKRIAVVTNWVRVFDKK
jgi:eukaryotic-like serine/threonine-protein kinase